MNQVQQAFRRLKAFVEKGHGHGLIAEEGDLRESESDLQTVGEAIGYDEDDQEEGEGKPAGAKPARAKTVKK